MRSPAFIVAAFVTAIGAISALLKGEIPTLPAMADVMGKQFVEIAILPKGTLRGPMSSYLKRRSNYRRGRLRAD
jgi:hypothetical protein